MRGTRHPLLLEDVSLTVIFHISKSNGQLIGLDLITEDAGGGISVSAVAAPDWKSPTYIRFKFDDGFEPIDLRYTAEDEKDGYSGKLTLEGIKDRKIGAACLDVYEEESDIFFRDFSGHIVDDDTLARLITMPNVLVTSHQAFLTEEALDNIAAATVKNLTDFFTRGVSENELCYH